MPDQEPNLVDPSGHPLLPTRVGGILGGIKSRVEKATGIPFSDTVNVLIFVLSAMAIPISIASAIVSLRGANAAIDQLRTQQNEARRRPLVAVYLWNFSKRVPLGVSTYDDRTGTRRLTVQSEMLELVRGADRDVGFEVIVDNVGDKEAAQLGVTVKCSEPIRTHSQYDQLPIVPFEPDPHARNEWGFHFMRSLLLTRAQTGSGAHYSFLSNPKEQVFACFVTAEAPGMEPFDGVGSLKVVGQ